MKKIVVFLTIAVAMMSCTEKLSLNKNEEIQYAEEDLVKTHNDVLYSEFSKILSKALASEPSLREFVKAEALKQFDRDYDVFYPFVKDVIVDGQRTFKEMLCAYDTELKMSEIEDNFPLLNILVPDWSWAQCFSCKTWDTEDSDVCVMFISANNGLPVYFEGKYEGGLEHGELMLSPVLIVGGSERVCLKSPATKGGEAVYDFIDEEFDGSKVAKTEDSPETKVQWQYYDRYISTEPTPAFLLESEIDPRVIAAYKEFGNDDYKAQRDYVYYGMTNTINAGKRNPRISEYLYKLKFDSFKGKYFSDDADDFKKYNNSYTFDKNDASDNTLRWSFLYTGYLELHFNIIIRNNDGSVSETQKVRSVNFGEVFQLANTAVSFRHKTWFVCRRWIYKIDLEHPERNFVPKWYTANIALPDWNIESQSTIMNIEVTEFDPATVIEKSKNVTSSVTTNFSTEVSGTVGGTIGNINMSGSIKTSYGVTSNKSSSTSIKVTRTLGEDDLGTAHLQYSFPIILRAGNYNGREGFYVKEISTGVVSMLILPRYE